MKKYKIILIPGFGLKSDSMELLKKEFDYYQKGSEIIVTTIMDVLNGNYKSRFNEGIDVCLLHSIAAPLISYQISKKFVQLNNVKKVILLDPTMHYSQFSKLLKSLVGTKISLDDIRKNLNYLDKIKREESFYEYLDYEPFVEQKFIDYLKWVKTYNISEITKPDIMNKLILLTSTDLCRKQLKEIFRCGEVRLKHLDVESHNPFLTDSKILYKTIVEMDD